MDDADCTRRDSNTRGTRWCGRNGGGYAEMIMPDLSVVDAILFPILLGVGVLVFLTAAVMLREP